MALEPYKRQVSFPKLLYPLYNNNEPRTAYQWISAKQKVDGAEGLWRIHDSIYDLTDFVASHPGGSQWLEFTKVSLWFPGKSEKSTIQVSAEKAIHSFVYLKRLQLMPRPFKITWEVIGFASSFQYYSAVNYFISTIGRNVLGTDITEAFETHHINNAVAEALLPKYFIRRTNKARNSPFTFKEDGFYKTLKIKIAEKFKELPKDVRKKSDNVTDFLFGCVLVLSPLCCWLWKKDLFYGMALTLILGFILSGLSTCAHNYVHSEFRITHAISHHMHTNTASDIELRFFLPFLDYLPRRVKPVLAQMGAFFYPIIFAFPGLGLTMKNLSDIFTKLVGKSFSWDSMIHFLLPLWMWLFSGVSLSIVIVVWQTTIIVSTFFFAAFGITAGHHSHTNFFEGDVPRDESLDWGIHQMDTIVERVEYMEHHFKSITRFGDHALHHLFPTLDHAELKYLYPTVLEHCEKFDIQFRRTTLYNALANNSKQLKRTWPNNFNNIKSTPDSSHH